jgi:hypothetical protein
MPDANNYNLIKHLDYIEATIIRMEQNSIACKKWAVSLFVALLIVDAFRFSKNMLISASSLARIVMIVFWYLDSHYLRLQRLFRRLYDDVRINDYEEDPYSMDYNDFLKDVQMTIRIMFSLSECMYWAMFILFGLAYSLTH